MFQTPVLILCFNRPEHLRKVLERVRLIKPKHLFISQDGPRRNSSTDSAKCDAVKRIIQELVDWPCTLKTKFESENLGCRLGVSSGISWFFEHVEEGIILEDDCLPEVSFFEFCHVLLHHFRTDSRVGMIGGCNSNFAPDRWPFDYFFSRYVAIWGWATWSDRWMKNDDIETRFKNTELNGLFTSIFPNEEERRKRVEQFRTNIYHTKHSWGYDWSLYNLTLNRLCIIPVKNLIENIGFDENASNTLDTESEFGRLSVESIQIRKHCTLFVPPPEYEQKLNARYRKDKSSSNTFFLQLKRVFD